MVNLPGALGDSKVIVAMDEDERLHGKDGRLILRILRWHLR
jgi:hypothetical protein